MTTTTITFFVHLCFGSWQVILQFSTTYISDKNGCKTNLHHRLVSRCRWRGQKAACVVRSAGTWQRWRGTVASDSADSRQHTKHTETKTTDELF